MRKIIGFSLLSLLLGNAALADHANNQMSPAQKEKQFIQNMVAKHHFNSRSLTTLLGSLSENPAVIASMTRPFEKKPWGFYRNYFLTTERITLGADYLKTHHALLEKMQKKYGIPASILVAIIGVETEYGLHLGKYSVLDTLYTLAFYYPPREKFFKKELEQYLVLTRDDHLPVRTLKGSYAGALGIPQFMPSSYRYYGVSANGNGRVNLFTNNDAIASVANYFHKMGWQPNQPIAQQLSSSRASINPKVATRLTLPLQDGPQYWATYRNFKVIMSYNHNVVYAMAVYQLSNAIEKQYEFNARQRA